MSQNFRHLCACLQSRLIKSVQPRARPKEFHIQSMMLTPLQYAVFVRIPAVFIGLCPGEFNGFFYSLPFSFEPFHITAKQKFPVCFYDAAHMPVHTGPEVIAFPARRQHQPKCHGPVLPLAVAIFQIPHGPLQIRKQIGKRISIIPYMRAGAFAAAFRWRAPFKTIERSVLQPQTGGALQDREIRRHRFQRFRRQTGLIQCLFKQLCLRIQSIPFF